MQQSCSPLSPREALTQLGVPAGDWDLREGAKLHLALPALSAGGTGLRLWIRRFSSLSRVGEEIFHPLGRVWVVGFLGRNVQPFFLNLFVTSVFVSLLCLCIFVQREGPLGISSCEVAALTLV